MRPRAVDEWMRRSAFREWIVMVSLGAILWAIVAVLALDYAPSKSVRAGVVYGLFVGTVVTVIRRSADRPAGRS